jgi:hypothetical protein
MRRTVGLVAVALVVGGVAPAYAADAPGVADAHSLLRAVEAPLLEQIVSLARQQGSQTDLVTKDWQQQYDRAKEKQRKGRAMTLIGAGVLGLGITMIATKTGVRESCGGFICTVNYTFPAYVAAGGGTLLVWGALQRSDGNRTIRDLEAERRALGPTAGLPVAPGTFVALSRGRASIVREVRW